MIVRRVLCGLAVVATALTISTVGPTIVGPTTAQAQDGAAQSQVVAPLPASFTPNIKDGIVYAINQVGSRIVVGGSFSTVANHGSSTILNRPHLLAFDATSGAVDTGFAPVLDGDVNSVEPGPSPNTVYVAGSFNHVGSTVAKGIVLLSTVTGAIVAPWVSPTLDGLGNAIRYVGGRLLVGGTFTVADGVAHAGLVSLNPLTGALDPYLNIQLTGHHNYNGTGANAGVGAMAMDVSPDGSRMIVIGNFKNADGVQHDQIVLVDLNSGSAAVDPNWNTLQFTAACTARAFDTYMRDVNWSPDGSYFVVVATGGPSSNNSDGTHSLCDAVDRWSATDTGTNVKPTWVDFTGQDTLHSVAITGTAIYIGGHQRWLNNPNGADKPGNGAVPRPGIAALDPVNGLPLLWNPGHAPRGAGVYAAFASANGVYFGSDQDYFGDFQYEHDKIGYFPLTGGYVPVSTATASLPANVYEAGPTASTHAGINDLAYRAYSPPTIGAQTTIAGTGLTWSTTRGAFMVGSKLFYGLTDGSFNQAPFDGTTVGASTAVDPYDDPFWDGVQTGSGQTYQGMKSGYYGEIANVTGAFYSDGRLYYSLAGQQALHWRYFSPDSGTIGGTEFIAQGSNFSAVSGMFLSGSTLYYASSATGSLHSVAFTNGGTNGANPSINAATDVVVSGPAIDGNDWRSRSMFLVATAANQLPTARATASCVNLACTFDGSTSSDSDGSVVSYAWTFGDGATGTGVNPSHTYAAAGPQSYTLTVTDNRGGVSPAFSGSVTPSTPPPAPIAFGGSAGASAKLATSVAVVTPSSVVAGDTELLYVATVNATAGVITTPAGWTKVTSQDSPTLQTAVFRKTATVSDPGSTVTASQTSAGSTTVQLVDYHNVGSAITTVGASDSTTATHVAPAIAVSASNSWVVSFWSDKSSTTTAWTLPAAVTGRIATFATGGGAASATVADSGGPVAVGTYPAQTASVGATASGKGAMVSLVLPSQ